MKVEVDLCCNDEYGQTELLTAITVTDEDGELILHLMADFDVGESIAITNNKTEMRINNAAYPIRDFRPWVGTILWDAVAMDLEPATQLINDLLAIDHWCLVEAESELTQAIDAERLITVELLKAALS